MAKVLKTIVMLGELFGAERLADCGGAPHTSLYTGAWVAPVLDMFEEIADAGLKAFAPYTVNPMPSISIPSGGTGQADHGARCLLAAEPPDPGAHPPWRRPLNNWSCACYLPRWATPPSRARW